MINKLKALKEKVGNMQEQMSNESRETETIQKSKNKMLEIKGRNEVCVSCTHQWVGLKIELVRLKIGQ